MSSGRYNQYIYGSAVRQPVYDPDYYDDPKRNRAAKRPVNRRVNRNRRRARKVSAAYALFLLGAAMIVLLVCVSYIKVQVGVAGQKERVGDLQTELSAIQDENDTRYNAIMDSVDLDQIRERATTQLGMTAATAGQVIGYDEGTDEYMEQNEASASGTDSTSGNY